MRLRRLLLCSAVVLGGCSHEQPFETPATGTDRPFQPGLPTRLTLNYGTDLHPSWSADGGSFLYAWQQSGVPVIDRCIGEMVPTGGTRVATICNPDPASADSADLFDLPAVSAGGRLLYLRSSSLPGRLAPGSSGVYLGTLTDPLSTSQAFPLPSTIPGGFTQGGLSHPQWVDESRVIYLATDVVYGAQCAQCPPDTLVTGLAVVDMDLRGPQPVFSVVPGTTGATSVALSSAHDAIYYTLAQDPVVYRRTLLGGQVAVAHDFGARGVARDVTVLGDRLVAVVGGAAQPIGGGNASAAGPLVSVDLTTGTESVLPTDQPLYFRRPAFAPVNGTTRLVAEGYAVTVTVIEGIPPVFDTTVARIADLYLYTSP